MTKIKQGDIVQVVRGKDSGKQGEVLKVLANNKLVVKGINIVKRSRKPNPQFGIQGGIIEFEKPIDVSNVMYFDKKVSKPSRIGFKVQEDGKKVRISKKSGEII